MMLIPESMGWSYGTHLGYSLTLGLYSAAYIDGIEGRGKTVALSICIAALKVRQIDKAPKCDAIPIDEQREANCQEPYHFDDGVPYCDTCGLFRASKVI